MLSEIDPVTGADMYTQFEHAVADGTYVAKVTRLHLPQSQTDASLGDLVTHACQPFGKWLTAILALIAEKFSHVEDCSLKTTSSWHIALVPTRPHSGEPSTSLRYR